MIERLWQLAPAAIVLVVASTWSLLHAAKLNALALGAEAAHGLGVDDGKVLRISVWLSSALAAIAVGLALMREWRGSLIAPMVMHGCSNGIVITLMVLAAR